MAVNLLATARLNTRPYEAGLQRISKGTAGLAAGQIAGAKAVAQADNDLTATKKRNGNEYVRATREATRAEQAAQNSAISTMRQGISAQRYLYGDLSRMSARAALGLAALPIAAVAAGVSWEKSFADVVRTADPDVSRSTLRVNTLRESLVDLVQSVPTSWGEATEIATLANQMGVASDQTVKFTSAVAMFSATSNVSVDQTATAFGRLNSIVKDVNGDYMGLADSILKVGVNSVATESEIINISTQISSIAGGVGFTSKEIVGLSGALASVRVPPELSRGVVTRVFGQISRAVGSGGASLEGFAKISGYSAEEFATAWRTEGKAGAAFQSFVSGLQKLGPRAEQELRGLGITSVRDVPVMLRLANAADSEGNVGGLLAQTMGDANNAAGETQRQYTIMADTIGAKLKVVGNNLMAFFDGMSRSSLGPIGDILDFITDNIRDLTDSLDEPAKLFGKINLPFTNAELIGWVTAAGLATAGVLALGSAFFKLREGMAGAKQFMGTFGGGSVGIASGDPTGVRRVAASWTAFPGQVKAGMSKATAWAAQGYGRMSASALRYQMSANAANRATTLIAGSSGPVRINNMDYAAAQAEKFQSRATAAATGVSGAFSRAGSAVTAVGRGIGAAAGFAFGPWGLLIGLAAGGLATWIESTRSASTSASDLSVRLAELGSSARALNELKQISIGGLFGSDAKPFKDGFKTMSELQREMDASYAELKSKAADAMTYGGDGTGVLAYQVGKENKAKDELLKAYKVVGDAFGEMYDAGNGAQGAALLQKFTGSSRNLLELLNSGEANKAKMYFEDLFNDNGIALTSENLDKLSRGELPELRAQMLGLAKDFGVTQAELESFDGGVEAFAAMAKGLEEVAKGFIDYKNAVKSATDDEGAFDMSAFSNSLQAQLDAQANWSTNLAQAAKIGGSEFVNALIEMGAESELPLQAIIDNYNATGGAIDGDWAGWMAQIVASTKTGAEQNAAALAAARDQIQSAFKDDDLTTTLSNALSGDQLQRFSADMEVAGTAAARKYAQGIRDGSMSVHEALAALALDARVKINPDFDITSAELSMQAIVALANGTVTTLQLDAAPDLALGEIWSVVQTASGETALVKVSAETGEAVEDVAYVVDTATGQTAVIPITGDEKEAIAALGKVDAAAQAASPTVVIRADDSQAIQTLNNLSGRVTYSTHEIRVMERQYGTKISNGWEGGTTMANGGVLSFYASGGIRENHVAQIAPAGSWRVWGEPETGGEAYIPLAKSKRLRSTAILDNVASRFGYSLVGDNVSRFANGGQYMAQSMARAQMRSPQNTSSTQPVSVIESVNFNQSSNEDQFREFSRVYARATRRP